MKCFRHIALSALVALLPLSARGELKTMLDSLQSRFSVYSQWCAPEKVYLHYDRSCYVAGETIWFKGWVQEASGRSSLPQSNFLYAELLDGRGEAVIRVKIKRTEDGFPGCLELPEDLESGRYTIRAYTLWQLNYSGEYLFNDSVRIIGANKEKKEKPENESDDIQISFWPEGGRYFAGQVAVIGFKAVDGLGRSVEASGFLTGDPDQEEIPVATTHDGMGSFAFVPQAGCNYGIRDASGKVHPLPPPSEEGATIQLRAHGDHYFINTTGLGGGSASLLLRNASDLYPLTNVRLDGKRNILKLEKSFFHPGINHLLLVDPHGMIIAERRFFIRDGKEPICRFGMERFPSDRRAKTGGTISLTDPDGNPIDGTCSISVVRGALKAWQQSDGITSYLGLSSELKGRINDPY